MKRIDKIYGYLKEHTKELTKEEVLNNEGITAGEIEENLNILRNNVSKELNELLRLDMIVKIKGRPVKFLHKEEVENILGVKIKEVSLELDSIEDILEEKKEENEDPFKALIGAERSLKNQVEQAKMAIFYPQGGLHTLIVGQTGVGKTLFSKMMYNYGKEVKRFTEQSPFVVFNCADYFNNPQLLLSQIFGHIKGAFTGADQEKVGLVEKANGGILFLDEIHRLPPEGQEMIFYFMDTGTYNKLGETERKRNARVLIIGATTEDPNSSMLKTFTRRIPIIINLPALHERTNEEKIGLLKFLFSNEAHRVNKPIKVSIEVVKSLLGSVTYGNIGQLKSNIQLVCAKGFLSSMNEKKDYLELDFKTLPENIKDGLFQIGKSRKDCAEIAEIVPSHLVINPEGYVTLIDEDSYEPPFNLYKIIEDKVAILKEEGLSDNYINKFITTDVNVHIKSFYNKFDKTKDSRDGILKIVDVEILEFAEKIRELAEKELKRKYNDRFLYALSLHLSSFFKRLKEKKYNSKNIYDTIEENSQEYKVALKIKDLISNSFKIEVPDVEVTYIAILLSSVKEEKQGNVGIVVAAHGNSTASSIVNVVQTLLGNSNICAVDMPLDVSPKEILEIVIDKVKSIDNGKGVLLLVDMGSLYNFESTIIERTGIQVRTLEMVSTPLTLEAMRKADILDMELDEIYNSLKEFRGYNNEIKKNQLSNKVIVTVCSSGKGAAIKLKEIVERIILDLTDENINIIPAGVRDFDKKIKELQKKYNVIAVVGVKKPIANIPFIPLEKLIDANGEKMLRQLLFESKVDIINEEQNIIVKDICEDQLKEFLTYLNPSKVIGLLLDFAVKLESQLGKSLSNPAKIRLIIHVACAMERMLINDGLNYGGDKNEIDKELYSAVDKCSQIFKKSLNINLTEDEKYYICESIFM